MIDFPTEQSIRRSYIAQRQLAQLHRWIALQIDPRADSTNLTTASLAFTNEGKSCDLSELSDLIRASKPAYLSCNDLTWPNPCERATIASTTLAGSFDNSEQPLLTDIALDNGKDHQEENARPTAIEHRILALKHRWHAIVEAPEKVPAALGELITPSFDMQWGYGGLSGFAELSTWLTKSAASMDAARHDIAAFAWQSTGQNTYQAEFDFVWYGYSNDLEPMHAESRHIWQIVDDPQDRYPRICQMSVEFLTPFHTVSGVNHD